MGQGYSLTTLSAGAAGIDMGDLPDLGFEATIGDARFMKTVRGRHRQGLVVAKIVPKPYAGTDFSKYLTAVTRERQLLEDIPNVLAYQRTFETVGYGYLLRQYMYGSLYERLSTQPFLEHIEKKWLAFQLLIAVRECHAKDVYHGDIKSENVLVTSWNWLYLSDFSGSFKPVYLPEDNPADFSFFFDLSGRRTCYLAPERFLSPGEPMEDRTTVTWAMDIFSVGCVIAELFLETPMFNLSQLLNYKQGQTNPLQTHLHKLEDPELRELVVHMIQLEPEARYSADEYLNFWRGKAFPDYFYNFLHQYMSLITDPTSGRAPITTGLDNLGEADDRIGRVYHDFDKIAYFLDYAPDSTSKNNRGQCPPKSVHASLSSFGATNHKRSAQLSLQKGRSHSEDGTFIFMTVVTSSMRNTARATARLQAIDLLLVFAKHLPDSAKLDRILPFLYSAMLDPSEVVKLAALQAIAHLLIMTDTASPINAYTPSDYLLQYFDTLFDKGHVQERPEIRAMYAQSLSPLSEAAARFSDTISALRNDGSQQLLFPGVSTTIARAATHGQINPQRAALMRLETHTKTLLHDESVVVRRALLLSVDTLCVFFGSAKTNDAILSHLNTLFTETDWQLKCSLFDSMANVAVCVGPTSVEEYVLPMMILALYDREEIVVERVLASMARIARLGLFRASSLHSLIDLIGRFTMHPNVWVQGASLSFISWAKRSLGMADVCCLVWPLLKPYLGRAPADLEECCFIKLLKKPVARSAYNIALKWAQTSRGSLFWTNIKKRMSVNRTGSAAPAISARDLTLNAMAKVPKDYDDQRWMTRLRDAGMLHEDEVKFLALSESILRVSMIEQAKDDKVVEQHARSDKTRLSSQTLIEETSNVLGTHARTDKVKTQPSARELVSASIEKPQTIADALLDASSTIGTGNNQGPSLLVPDRVFRTDTARSELDRIMRDPTRSTFASSDMDGAGTATRSNTPSDGQRQTRPATDSAADSTPHPSATARKLMQWQSAHGKANAETSMSSMNVLGEVDHLNSREASGQASPNPAAARNAEDRHTGHGKKLARNVGQLQAQQRAKSTTSGSLQVIDLGENMTPMHQPVNLETSEQSSKTTWRPTGTMVAMFTEHTAAVSCIAISPNHAFIVTGCDDGCVKIWDTSRLERNVAHRSRLTYRHESTARICSLCFIGKTSTFAAATSDGRVTLVKVDCRESSEHTLKYARLEKVYQWVMPAGSKSSPLQMTYLEPVIEQRTVCLLLIATHDSKIHTLNVHTTSLEYSLNNAIHHGALTSVCLGPSPYHWLMLGTAHGVLDLWDLRFRICIRSVAFPAASPINSIQLRLSRHATERNSASVPSKRQVVYVTGGSGSSDITAWDIHELRCTNVYRTHGSEVSLSPLEDLSLAPTDIKPYTTWNPDVTRDDTMLKRFSSLADPQIDASSSTSTSTDPSQQTHSKIRTAANNGFRALFVGQRSHAHVTSATSTNMTGNASRNAPYLITAGPGAALRFWDLKDDRTFSRNSGFISGSPYGSSDVLAYEVTGRRGGITVHEERIAPGAEPALVSSSKPDISKGSVVGSKVGKDNSSGKNTDKVGRSQGGLKGLGAGALFHRHLDAILAIAVVERPYPMVVSADRSGVVFVWA